jgi:hypothetical protein
VRKRTLAAVASALLLFAMGCGKTDPAARDQQAIRAAIQNYLAKRPGLNLSGMDTDVKNISIQQNTATAQVEFRSKQGDATMRMTYALERQGDAWVVRSGSASGDAMGHPPAGAAAPPAGMGDLPPGHPPVGSEPPKTPPKKN